MKKPLRIAIVTDIHYGPDRYSKKGDAALELLENFIRRVNALKVDLVVDLGDRISNTDLDTDLNHLRKVSSKFQNLNVVHYHLVGNHDVVHMPIPEQEEILDSALHHQSLDMSGWHLVFWSASCVLHNAAGFRLAQGDLEWLEADLKATDLPCIIFSHMPVDTGSMVGNYYFDKLYAGGGQHQNASLARHLIERSGKVVAVISGHVHWNQLHIMDAIPHISLQSLSETFTTHPHPAGAWGLLKLHDTIELDIAGREPMKFTLPVKPMNHHWLPPME